VECSFQLRCAAPQALRIFLTLNYAPALSIPIPGRFCPAVIVASNIVAAIKKNNHVSLVKRLIAGAAEVGWNACKVEVDPVLVGNGIDTVEIADPLVTGE
jgi:hypothetical protein